MLWGMVFVLLEHQDRSRWDRSLIEEGLDLLRLAHETEHEIGPYVLQAAVAAVHAAAPSFGETDWHAVVEIYDRLAIEAGTTVVLLNRAVALSYVRGPEAGLTELDALAANFRQSVFWLLLVIAGWVIYTQADRFRSREQTIKTVGRWIMLAGVVILALASGLIPGIVEFARRLV